MSRATLQQWAPLAALSVGLVAAAPAHAGDIAVELGFRGGRHLAKINPEDVESPDDPGSMVVAGQGGLCADAGAWMRVGQAESGMPVLGASFEFCASAPTSLMTLRGGLGIGAWELHDNGLHHRFAVNLGAGQSFVPVPDVVDNRTTFVSIRPEAMFGHFRTPVGYSLGVYLDIAQAVHSNLVDPITFAPKMAIGFKINVVLGKLGSKSFLRGGGANGGTPMSY